MYNIHVNINRVHTHIIHIHLYAHLQYTLAYTSMAILRYTNIMYVFISMHDISSGPTSP